MRVITPASLLETAQLVRTTKSLAQAFPDYADVYLRAAGIYTKLLARDLRVYLKRNFSPEEIMQLFAAAAH